MSYHPLDSVLGARGRVRCLRHLLLYGAERTALALARQVGLSHRAATMALATLVESGLVRVRRAGSARLYEADLKRTVNKDILLPAFQKEKELLKGIVREIRAAVRRAPLSMVLFGSRARGEALPGSDIDIFVLVNARDKSSSALNVESVIERIRDRHGLKADILVETPESLAAMKRKRAPLWKALARDGEPLYGAPLKEIAG